MIKFKQSKLVDNLVGTRKLAHASWLELQHGLDYDPDWDLLVSLENIGALQLYQVLHLGKVVGMAVVIIAPSTHHKGLITATIDCIYIQPQSRGVGKSFLHYIETQLTLQGVSILTLGLPPAYGDEPSFLKDKPYRKTDNLFTRLL